MHKPFVYHPQQVERQFHHAAKGDDRNSKRSLAGAAELGTDKAEGRVGMPEKSSASRWGVDLDSSVSSQLIPAPSLSEA